PGTWLFWELFLCAWGEDEVPWHRPRHLVTLPLSRWALIVHHAWSELEWKPFNWLRPPLLPRSRNLSTSTRSCAPVAKCCASKRLGCGRSPTISTQALPMPWPPSSTRREV